MSIHEIYVPGYGPINPRIAIVGEAPSFEEVEQLKPFVGASGRFLDKLLNEAGIDRSQCWVTNACKYMIPPQTKDKKIPFKTRAAMVNINLEQQFNELRQELWSIKPNIVIALGGTALWALTGKTKIQQWRGSIILGMGLKTIATYHPAHILHQEGDVTGYWQKQVMVFDLKRAKVQSGFSEIRRPNRTLNICKSSAQLYDFQQRFKNSDKPAVDIEAHPNGSGIPICIGISYNYTEGITIPLWNIDNISSMSTSDLTSTWSLLSDILNTAVIGQNFGYDRDKIRRLGFIIQRLASDTMLKSFVINPELPKNLAFNTSIYTEEPYYKDEGMYEGSIEDLMRGCALDACVTKEIDIAQDIDLDQMELRPYYENFVLPLHDLYSYIESNGLRVSEEARSGLIRKYVEWDETIRYNLFKVAGNYVNTASPKQVAELLYGIWDLPQRKGTGEEVLTQLLNSGKVKDEQHRKGIELILEDRQVKKTIGTYLTAPADYDGRMRTSYFICLDTGRSSTSQQDPPIRPMIEGIDEHGKKKRYSIGCAFQTITKHGDIGSDVRTMYVPDEGEIFLQADSSQAEARVIFLLAEDYDALRQIDSCDYHALTASWFFGGTEQDYSKKFLGYESPIRFAGKTLRHAGHLGASKGRAAVELNTQARKYKIDFKITELQAGRALEIFHKKQPNIKQVFQKQVKDCIDKNRRLSAPVPYGIEANKGGTRIFFERAGEELYRQAFSYLPQRVVSENIKVAAIRVRKQAEWIKILVESHDSLLVSVPIQRTNEAATILKTEFERPIDFSKCSLPRGELIIPCEIESGFNYRDLSKYKWLVEETV